MAVAFQPLAMNAWDVFGMTCFVRMGASAPVSNPARVTPAGVQRAGKEPWPWT